jgi:hypothetical protein
MAKWAESDLRIDVDNITHDDLVYFAGLFDGEGCVTLQEGRRGHLVVGMTDMATMWWVHDTFGGTLSTEPRPNPKHSTLYKWVLHRRADVEWLTAAILPYCRCKAERLTALLTLIDFSKLRPGLTGQELDDWNAKLPSLAAPLTARYWRDTEQPALAKTL